jgi:hypothetical protein
MNTRLKLSHTIESFHMHVHTCMQKAFCSSGPLCGCCTSTGSIIRSIMQRVELKANKQKLLKTGLLCTIQTFMHTRLPDGLFTNPKSYSGSILEGLRLENVNIFYCHLEYFTNICDFLMTIWNILRTFGIFYDHLVHLSGFGIT